MKQEDVKIGGIYITKIGEELARVEVVHAEMPTSYSPRTRYAVRRIFKDGTIGPVLPKRRTAAALRPSSDRSPARDVRKVHEYSKQGDFVVRTSVRNKRKTFFDSRSAHDWAEELLKSQGVSGDWADFYRTRVSKGHTGVAVGGYKGSPWTEPFSRLERDEYGVIRRGDLRNSKPARTK